MHRSFALGAFLLLAMPVFAQPAPPTESPPPGEPATADPRPLALDPFSKPLRDSVVGIYRSLGLNDRAREHQVEIFCWTVWECD